MEGRGRGWPGGQGAPGAPRLWDSHCRLHPGASRGGETLLHVDFRRWASRGVRAETATVSSPKCAVIRGSGHRTVTQETKTKTREARTSA